MVRGVAVEAVYASGTVEGCRSRGSQSAAVWSGRSALGSAKGQSPAKISFSRQVDVPTLNFDVTRRSG